MEAIPALWEALQNSELPTALRLSDLAYPLVNAAHIAGLALLFGAIVPFDLRLIGFWPSVPLYALSRILLPVAIAGLILALTMGGLLFSVHAVKYAEMGVFQLKLLLVAAAILNALLLRRAAAWKHALAEPGRSLPPRVKAAAVSSILLWSGVILCGRMIAYFA